MTYNVDTAKARLGIPDSDTSKDDAITACLAMGMAVAETYCDRGFQLTQEVQEIYGLYQRTLRTYRYPIKVVNSVKTISPGADPYEVDPSTLTIFKKDGQIIASGGLSGTQVQIDYEGGYDPLPVDLEWALWGIFDAIWYSTPGFGVAPGDTGTAEPGVIKSFWINGVRLEYSTSSSSAAAAVNAEKEELYGVIPLPSVSVLSRYRAESALSGG